jgi:formate-dependent nitrite reductase membrane component NrfD
MVFQEAFEWYIAIYLFLGGVGAGAILSASFADLYNREKYIYYIKSASLIGMPAVAFGTLFLLLDLGQGLTKPWLLILLFANPASAITWGTIILTLFIIFATIYGAYNFKIIKFGGSKFLPVILILLSLGTAGYTGVLLGVLKAIPLWNQTLIPVLFIISAISTGISATVVLKELLFKNQEEDIKFIESGHFYLLLFEFLMIIAMIIIALNGVPELAYSINVLLAGKYAFQFWIIFMILGLIIPLFLYCLQEINKLHMKGGFLVVIELLVLLGGYYLRYLIIHAGVFTEKFTNYIN